MATIEPQQVAFAPVKATATLKFKIKEKTGFIATAKLDHDVDTVAKWKHPEIVGKVVTEALLVPGLYTLEVKPVLTSKRAMDINVEVTMIAPGGQQQVQTMAFVGKSRGDICQALAFVLVQ